MLVRRLLVMLALGVMSGAAAACGTDADTDSEAKAAAAATAGGARASAPASGAPGGGTAGTEEVCKAVVGIFEKEKVEILGTALKLATAETDEEKAEAKKSADTLVARLTPQVSAETAKAADPKLKVALDQFLTVVTKLLTPQAATDADFEAKYSKAIDDAAAYCPALKN